MSDHLRPHDAALERLRALHPLRIDLSLDRMLRLCAALGNPQDRLPPVIHVAGTNGKGSTVAGLRAIAEAAGLKVHVFTSPHLVRFVERIRLAGELISEDHLAEVLERVEAANGGLPITFFEITAAAAFLAFAETPADLCIIEVGLGGVLDATNVVSRPAVCVITPVDMDHREFLGDTIAQIASEKAGILKRGVPAIIARQNDEAMAVIERTAAKTRSPLTVLGQEADGWRDQDRFLVQTQMALHDLPLPALYGAHQIDNATLAVLASLALGDDRITQAALAKGVSSIIWPARFQRLMKGPLAERAAKAGSDLWLDGGHNPHAARALATALGDLKARDGRDLVLICGLLGNKDAAGFFEAFATLNPKIFTVGFDADAAASPQTLAQIATQMGLSAKPCVDVNEALDLALNEGSPRTMICGSLYLAGEVLGLDPSTWPN
jgi:dihydrofolate synthase / folylpolyglutamate synthase